LQKDSNCTSRESLSVSVGCKHQAKADFVVAFLDTELPSRSTILNGSSATLIGSKVFVLGAPGSQRNNIVNYVNVWLKKCVKLHTVVEERC
jgi:hypothetical protein